jgi:galactokinase
MYTTLLKEQFKELFGPGATIYAAPGRINLIGEHVDYNGGFVLPGAIDKAMYCAIRPNGTDMVQAYALDLKERATFGLTEADAPDKGWAKYIFGVVREMEKWGRDVPGFDVMISGDVPLGAGMSSSAALESAVGFALNDQFNLGFTRIELAKIGQGTEHNYVGVKCGIMDQFASCMGKAGSLIRLDCFSLEYEYVPFNPQGYRLVLLDTCDTHSLVEGAYNRRRESCEIVVAKIAERHPEVRFLRDVTPEMLDEVHYEILVTHTNRAKYVVDEIQRVSDVCEALKKDDYETVGKKMYETHEGLKTLFQVSTPKLDLLNDLAKFYKVTGSRLMGGGFGGCTINLIKEKKADEVIAKIGQAYYEKWHSRPKVYEVVIGDGARKLEDE